MSEPAPPATGVDICNLALNRLGQTVEITDIATPEGKAAIICARHYPMTRRRLLRGPRVFNFAKEYVLLTLDALVTPAFGFGSAFQLPNDNLRVLTLGDVDNDLPTEQTLYKVRGNHVFTDENDGDDTLDLVYIRDVTTVGLWDAMFVNLMRLELAMDMAPAFTLKSSLVKDIKEELMEVRLEAGAASGQENPPKRVSRSKWLTARRFGSGRDTTRNPI